MLEQHSAATHPNGLANNWGDSYLCQYNLIYRNIREAAIKYGYKYSSKQNDAYQALPLSQLAIILSTKTIPYLDNVSVLKQVEEQMPYIAVWDDINNLRKNFLFHESCHAVAREKARILTSATDKNITNQEQALNMLIEESFANTCELLAVVNAEGAAHKIFYEWNSYTALFDAKSNLKNAQEEIGIDIFSKIIFFGYLHSNLLFNNLDEKQLNRIINIVTQQVLSAKQLKTIKALVKICFTLDTQFKEVTTRFYMRLNGVKHSRDKRINLNYLENFEKNPEYRKYVDDLILVIASQ